MPYHAVWRPLLSKSAKPAMMWRMTVLPIVDRELRVAARRAGTYRTRLWAALGATALAVWIVARFAMTGGSSAEQGHALFYTLSSLAFLYCLCIGARVTSDCISEEKREGTLGLLFLTDLKGLDVVLGKFVASSLDSIYGLLAVLPLLAMTLLLGGVTLAQFGQMVLVLFNALFFSLSVGIFVSAMSRNDRKAMFGTLLAVFAPIVLPYIIAMFLVVVMERMQDAKALAKLVPWFMANPLYPFLISLPLPRPPIIVIPAWSFWVSLGAVHAVSWSLLLITALILPRVWKDRVRPPRPVTRRPSLLDRWREFARGDTEQRRALRFQLLNRNPYLWLVSRDRLKPGYAWFFLASMILIWLWGYVQHGEVMFDYYPLAPTLMMVHGFLKIWVVAEVSHRLIEDQKNGALELLLSTPLTHKDIARGQDMALWRQFARPLLVLSAIELAVFQSHYPVRQIAFVLIVLALDVFTLECVALRLSLAARGINEAVLKSVALVMVLPWVLYSVLWPFWEQFMRFTVRRRRYGSFEHRMDVWFVVCVLVDLALILIWVRPQLLTQAGAWARRWAGGGREACQVRGSEVPGTG
jgi:ABC-type transport system involved in cytochrome c biogenesis permease component